MEISMRKIKMRSNQEQIIKEMIAQLIILNMIKNQITTVNQDMKEGKNNKFKRIISIVKINLEDLL